MQGPCHSIFHHKGPAVTSRVDVVEVEDAAQKFTSKSGGDSELSLKEGFNIPQMIYMSNIVVVFNIMR